MMSSGRTKWHTCTFFHLVHIYAISSITWWRTLVLFGRIKLLVIMLMFIFTESASNKTFLFKGILKHRWKCKSSMVCAKTQASAVHSLFVCFFNAYTGSSFFDVMKIKLVHVSCNIKTEDLNYLDQSSTHYQLTT